MMDGNFFMIPPKFIQLFAVHIPLRDTVVSLVYISLKHKIQETYEKVLRKFMRNVYTTCIHAL